MDECIFCRLIDGEIPSEIVYEGERVVAFKDINPKAPVHLLVVPRKHISALSDAVEEDQGLLGELALTAAELAKREGLAASGFRLVVNNGPEGGQEVFHLHYHLLGGRQMTTMG